MIDKKLRIKEALRQMLLPIPSNSEDDCIQLITDILSAKGVDADSHDEFLRVKYDVWKSDGTIDSTFKEIVGGCLKISNDLFGDVFASIYFTTQANLRSSNPFITFELSVILLSHLQLISNLADKEQMSSVKILKVIQSIDNRLDVISWKDIQLVLRKIRLLPELNDANVQALYLQDEALQEQYFADADMGDASFQIGEKAKSLQFPFDAETIMNRLSDNAHIPYLQILHYQSSISAVYDHVFSSSYEFSPRGAIANNLFVKWHGLLHTSNPFLNNAKAVDVLDENWARSRNAKEYEQASVLVRMLKGLDGMGFSAAQELTKWIRMWLIRYINIHTTRIVPLSAKITSKRIDKILHHIKRNPTQTYGILEQRFVDVLAASAFADDKDWRSRGLGDSVNSNNLSKRKLGDCDFQNSLLNQIVAYEAHGGVLSKIYYEGHVRTFKRSLLQRLEELEKIADIKSWQIKVIFVAYGFEKALPTSFNVDKLTIKVEYKTFEELYKEVDPYSNAFALAFKSYFIDVVNDRRTPKTVRDIVHKILV